MRARHILWFTALLSGGGFAEQEPRAPPEHQEDLPDHQAAFQEKPYGDLTPFEQQALAQASEQDAMVEEETVVGEVLRLEGDQLWLRAQGANIPFTVTPFTEVAEGTLLIPGEEVRTTFQADPEENVALSLEPLPKPPTPAERQPIDTNYLHPPLVPDVGESRGPGSPVPAH